MVQEVVEINGVKVYSDKTLARVDNHVVTFTDGSTCDVSTREIVNQGRGTISFSGGEEGSNEIITKGPLTFLSSALLVRSVPANVRVVPYSGSQIEVTVTGPDRKVGKISVEEQQGWVVIDGSAAASSGGISIRGSFSSAFRQSYSYVSNVSIGSDGDDTTVTVRVPKGATVATQGTNHRVEIGDIEGNLDVGNSGSGNVIVGRVKSAKLTNRGTGNVIVAYVRGTLDIDNGGNSRVTVVGGELTELTIDNGGTGKVDVTFLGQPVVKKFANSAAGSVKVNGKLVDPTIDNGGTGNVTVAYVSGSLTIDNGGTGKVTVNDGKVTDLHINNGGTGKVAFGGRSRSASLHASGMGNIDVAYVEQRPRIRRSGMGRIRVGNWQN